MPGHSVFSFSERCWSRFLGRDGDAERDEVEAASDRFVHRAQARLVVADDTDFERWLVVEKILPHEAGRDGISSGELLDPTLVPVSAGFGFMCDDQAGTAKGG